MAKRNFWRGFAAGTAAGAGGSLAVLLGSDLLGRSRAHVLRIEKSLQIGCPVERAFEAWTHLEQLPQMSGLVHEVRRDGDRSHWKLRVDGRIVEWDAEIEQFIPNQAIGWKSLRGPKNTGRVTFSRVGDDTLMQVTMNYAPPMRLFRRFMRPVQDQIQFHLEQVLRDFKAALEGKGQAGSVQRSGAEKVGPGTEMTGHMQRATGTFGAPPVNSGSTSRQGSETSPGGNNPVEFTRPPEAKS